LWWVRRDLRLTDNEALAAAVAEADQVIPVFVLDPAWLKWPYVGRKGVAFLLGGLRRLDEDLRARGGRLVVREGDAREELRAVWEEGGAEAIFAEEDFTPYGREREGDVAEELPLERVGGGMVHRPGTVLKADGTAYRVFGPFGRRWRALPGPEAGEVRAAPGRLVTPAEVGSVPIPTEPALPRAVPFAPGEGEGQQRLAAFVEGEEAPIYRYGELRDRLDVEGTSRLSPYLRLGMVSARQAVVAALEAMAAAPDGEGRRGAESWLKELVWREFYGHVLYHFPYVLERSFRAELGGVAWENDEGAFGAWCEGRTGYPVVDAGMRQLAETGWMHNRARMVVASFLVKDLLVDWRWGEGYFMEQLVDGDVAANNGGWQWTAGTGTDAAPYFRVFNPVLQGRKHDPEGAYVRRWVPELARVPGGLVHEPWRMPLEVQEEAGCVVGRDYAGPMVDHGWARERALAAYGRARETA
jgi:deoxyribodipyrimidine photo-lyase